MRIVPDVLISASCARDAMVWRKAVTQIEAYIEPKSIYVVVPDCDWAYFRSLGPDHAIVLRESDVLREILPSLDEAIRLAKNVRRRGWYVQQFAKLAVLFNLGEDGRYLIWDSDTVPLKKLSFWTPDGEPCFYIGDEIHPPYFEVIYRALGLDKQVAYSFISQCLPINSSSLRALRTALQCDGRLWFEKLIESIDFSQGSGFSEYELIGTFLASRAPGGLALQQGQWLRGGRTKIKDGSGHPASARIQRRVFDYVAYEQWNRGRGSFRHDLRAIALNWLRVQVPRLYGSLRSLRKLASLRQLHSSQADNLLREALAGNRFSLLQVGACDGVTEDPVNQHLARGSFEAVLVEPLSGLIHKLHQTYVNHENVRLEVCAAGAASTQREMFFIPPSVALEMNGQGPENNWALGQGTFSRSVVVCSIFQNAFRGPDYCARIPEWISSISSEYVDVKRTADLAKLLKARPWGLVLDVQGAELEVLRGLDHSDLPDWIYMETDGSSDGKRLIDACHDLGFQLVAGGHNSFLRKRATAARRVDSAPDV